MAFSGVSVRRGDGEPFGVGKGASVVGRRVWWGVVGVRRPAEETQMTSTGVVQGCRASALRLRDEIAMRSCMLSDAGGSRDETARSAEV
jgi:hypothetical protein